MKITIGSLIRKELANPDSLMSKCVRKHKAWVRISKNDPDLYKIEIGLLRNTLRYYEKRRKEWHEDHLSYHGWTIGQLLGLTND